MVEFLSSWMWSVLVLGVAGVAATAGVRVAVHGLEVWWWRWSLTAWELRLPRTATVGDVSRWVGTLRAILPGRRWWSLLPRWPVAIEITATSQGVRYVLVVPRWLRADVRSTLAAALPGARLTELVFYLIPEWPLRCQAGAEARLTSTGDLLATDRGEDTSRHLLAALQPLHAGERIRVQWLLGGALVPRWALDPQLSAAMVPAYLKQTDPLLVAVGRVAVSSPRGRRRARALHGRVWAALRGMNTPRARITRRWALPSAVVAARLVLRSVSRGRWPLVLTARELGGLLGLVAGEASLPGAPTPVSQTLPPPPSMPTTGLVVAVSNYPGMQTTLRLSTPDRLRHLWIIGPPGAGKSTLLANMISYDIHHGDGLVVIDARGDLVADVLDRVPADRVDDVIVIDPTSGDHVVGFNPLTAGPPEQAAGFAFHVLHSVYARSWGPRTADIARACLLTLTVTKAPDGQAFTLVEVPELLTNSRFRRAVTAQPGLSPQLHRFWRWFNSLSEPHQANICAPLLNKLRTFTLSSPLRAMLGQTEGVHFGNVLANNRIVLIALKKGLLGQEVSGLMGSLVVSAVWQAALARANIPKDQRQPFWLVVDEFQDVMKLPLDLADMLAQARGLGLGLTLAHQYLDQLSTQLQAAVVGTTRSHIAFQLGYTDAQKLSDDFKPLTADDLNNLAAYEIALRPCLGGTTAPPVTGTTYPLPNPVRDGAALAAASQTRYGLPVATVDEQITARATPPATRGTTRWNRIPSSGGEQP